MAEGVSASPEVESGASEQGALSTAGLKTKSGFRRVHSGDGVGSCCSFSVLDVWNERERSGNDPGFDELVSRRVCALFKCVVITSAGILTTYLMHPPLCVCQVGKR